MIRLPFSFLPPQFVERTSKEFKGVGKRFLKAYPRLEKDLMLAEMKVEAEHYLAMCFVSNAFLLGFMFFVASSFIYRLVPDQPFLLFAAIVSILITLFAFMQQLLYPKLISSRRVRGIEKNLMAALQNMVVQMNSGVPLFDSISNIAYSNYGELSVEFKKAVRMINSGLDFDEALEKLAEQNPSLYFRRAIWQLLNGLKAGGDIKRVLEGIIRSLAEEQTLQIQKFGATLNPIAMFYMLTAVILPALGITFIVVISSFVAIPEGTVKIIFYMLLVFVFLFQMMFVGLIKSKRPNLLS